ncbi:hypothetical protein FRAHR75_770042 [Frankia sp. Hr75.2]|nr:hypothetical protein FRAHR75_770042 [Frankia sp. Hr75.2]
MLGTHTQEASPSPVYGAALLMRLGAYTPSGVQIPEPPLYQGFLLASRNP